MDKPPRQLGLSPATRAAQALRFIDPASGGVTPAIHLSSTYARDETYALRDGYIYAREGTPTTRVAEDLITDLTGGAGSYLFSSGMAAIVTMLETLKSGDHVVAPRVMYHGVLNWLVRLESLRGIKVSLFDQASDEALKNAIIPGETKLVWIETPINPNWDVLDIAAAADAAHAAGAVLVTDCTAAPPATTDALALGADYVFYSATKYLGGHSDLIAGVLTCARAGDAWDELGELRKLMGNMLASFDAWLLIRGIRTLYLRYERASDNALTLARHFEGHPKIAAVLYPGLESHPNHAVAVRQMQGGFGGMLSLLTHDEATAAALVRHVQVFIPATSLGGVESLIEHRKAVEGPNSIVPDTLLRLSIGIEDVRDLIADLEQALDRA